MIQNLDWKGNEGIENMMGIYIQHPGKRFIDFFKLVAPISTLKVTDVDDLMIQNLDWKGNDGIENMMGIYIQHPGKRFIDFFKLVEPISTLTGANASAQSLAVSPNRKVMRKLAAQNLIRAASKMKSNAIEKAGMVHFDVGNVVKIALADVDKAKTDSQNLTGVIVNINRNTMMARVAVKSGLLKNWYDYHKLAHVSGHGNDLELLGLNHAFIGWSMMNIISEREASRNESMVGGQGKGGVTCNCKTACRTKLCSCYKARRKCNSACHRNNHKCTNHDCNE
jgi:hypothetical protein